jgi:hypothetical protein
MSLWGALTLPALGKLILLSFSEITTVFKCSVMESETVCPRAETAQSAYSLEKEKYPSGCRHSAKLHNFLTASFYCLGPKQQPVTDNGAHPDLDKCHWDSLNIHLLPVGPTQQHVTANGAHPDLDKCHWDSLNIHFLPVGPTQQPVTANGAQPDLDNCHWDSLSIHLLPVGPTQHPVTANGAHPDLDKCHWDSLNIHLLPVGDAQIPVTVPVVTQPPVAASGPNTASYYCLWPIESTVKATGFHPASCNSRWGQWAPVTDTGAHQHPVVASGTHPPSSYSLWSHAVSCYCHWGPIQTPVTSIPTNPISSTEVANGQSYPVCLHRHVLSWPLTY